MTQEKIKDEPQTQGFPHHPLEASRMALERTQKRSSIFSLVQAIKFLLGPSIGHYKVISLKETKNDTRKQEQEEKIPISILQS